MHLGICRVVYRIWFFSGPRRVRRQSVEGRYGYRKTKEASNYRDCLLSNLKFPAHWLLPLPPGNGPGDAPIEEEPDAIKKRTAATVWK